MREVTDVELEKLMQSANGRSYAELYDQILPGFKEFVERDPAFKQIVSGSTELTALMYVFAIGNKLSPDALVALKALWLFAASVGYYMREHEGEKVPVGATIN